MFAVFDWNIDSLTVMSVIVVFADVEPVKNVEVTIVNFGVVSPLATMI